MLGTRAEPNIRTRNVPNALITQGITRVLGDLCQELGAGTNMYLYLYLSIYSLLSHTWSIGQTSLLGYTVISGSGRQKLTIFQNISPLLFLFVKTVTLLSDSG